MSALKPCVSAAPDRGQRQATVCRARHAGDKEFVANPTGMTWDEALASFERELTSRGAAERTRRAYRTDLVQFAGWAMERGLHRPDEVEHRDVRLFAARLSESGAAAATVARKLASVRSFYDHLVRIGGLGQNPADLVASPKRASKLPKVLAPEQMAELLDRIPAHTPLEVRDRAMFELAYSCGLRCEEITDLDLDAIDFESEQLRVRGKGDKERLLPVGEPAQRALQRYLETARPALLVGQPDEQALLLSRRGRRLSSSDVRRRLRRWVREAAIGAGISPHSLRHAFATHLLRAAPIYARFRSYSAMRPFRPRRFTPVLIQPGCAGSTSSHTRVPSVRIENLKRASRERRNAHEMPATPIQSQAGI